MHCDSCDSIIEVKLYIFMGFFNFVSIHIVCCNPERYRLNGSHISTDMTMMKQIKPKLCAYLLMIWQWSNKQHQNLWYILWYTLYAWVPSVSNDSSMEHNNITSSSITNKTELTTVRSKDLCWERKNHIYLRIIGRIQLRFPIQRGCGPATCPFVNAQSGRQCFDAVKLILGSVSLMHSVLSLWEGEPVNNKVTKSCQHPNFSWTIVVW